MWISQPKLDISPRVGSSVSYIASQIVLFAGANHEQGPLNDTYIIKDKKSTRLDIKPSNAPPPRYDHAACIISENELIIFGGCGETGPLNDSWIFSIDSHTWTRKHAIGNVASPRTCQYLPMCKGFLWVFGGGIQGDEAVHDLSVFRVDPGKFPSNKVSYEWSVVCCDPSGPPTRQGHSLVEVDGSLYLFGGMNGSFVYDDLWKFDTTELKWTKLEVQVKPTGRSGHACVSLNNARFAIYGGLTRDPRMRVLDDIWVFDGKNNIWAEVDSMLAAPGSQGELSLPENRLDCAVCRVPVNLNEYVDQEAFFLFGGMDFGATFNDSFIKIFE